jgi:hypothetical protein
LFSADENPETPISAIHPTVGHIGQYKSDLPLDEECHRLLKLPHLNVDSVNPKSFDLGEIPKVKLPAKKRAPKLKTQECESWCEKYKPKLACVVAGNEKIVNRLRNWLEGWTDSNAGANRAANYESGMLNF